MSHEVVFSDQAAQDLQGIYVSLSARFGKRVAASAVNDLYAHCAGFDLFPYRGTMRDDLAPGLRLVGYRRLATIAFFIADCTVTIARIFSAGQSIRLT